MFDHPIARHLIVGALAAILLLLVVTPIARADGPDPRYWRLADIRAAFDAWEVEYPGIFHQSSLGLSGEGATIPLARISDQAGVLEPEPRLLFHAAQHANECNGTGAVMKTIAALLAGYGQDPQVTARVDGLELIFIPVLNPDGHAYVFSGATYWMDWRKTLRDNNGNGLVDYPVDGVDLNRNWDWYWNDYLEDEPASHYYKGPWPFSEPEVAALRDFVVVERPLLVVDYHSPATIAYNSIIFWPWQSTHGGGMSPDADVAGDVAANWAAATLNENGHAYSSLFGYDTLPKEQCWVYGNTGILTFVMEISDQCWWTDAAVDTIAARVARGSTYLMDRTLNGPGVTGTVTDAVTGLPLQAEVILTQLHDTDVGPRLADGRTGMYQRLTLPGTYTIKVSLRDYHAQIQSATVGASGWTTVDFALQPDVTAVEDDGANRRVPEWLRMPNPVRKGQTLSLALPSGQSASRVDLIDLRGRRVATLGARLAAGRTHELPLPPGLASGVYLLRVEGGRTRQLARLVVLD